MNELFDKLIIRIVFAAFICLLIFVYRYIHVFLYPSTRDQVLKQFFPQKNAADTVHLFARIMGISLIMSEFYFQMSDGIFIALFNFGISGILSFISFIASIYIAESIVLYNFDYYDEILKRKNMAYALISFALVFCVAMIVKSSALLAKESLIMFIFIWLYSTVLFGFACKSYSRFTRLSFNRLVIQKNITAAISFTGFIAGWTAIIIAAITNDISDVKWFLIQSLLKVLLAIIIYPLFHVGLVKIYRIQVSQPKEKNGKIDDPELGEGVYEAVIFLSSCLLTSVITGHINFGTFYPLFF